MAKKKRKAKVKRFGASPRGIVKAVRAALRLNRAGRRVKVSVRTKR
jgi:hypothetical protein